MPKLLNSAGPRRRRRYEEEFGLRLVLVRDHSQSWVKLDLLFLSSSLSSVVTAVSRRSKSIQSAASDTARSSPEAISTRVLSLAPLMRSGLREKEVVLPEMKSDKTQKKVTVWPQLASIYK